MLDRLCMHISIRVMSADHRCKYYIEGGPTLIPIERHFRGVITCCISAPGGESEAAFVTSSMIILTMCLSGRRCTILQVRQQCHTVS